MRTRNDIDPENTWVISDTHFHDEKNATYHIRPPDVDQLIIAEWRKAVGPDATIIHLGDVNYNNNARFKHILQKELTGRRKLLVKWANHDRQGDGFYRKCGFSPVEPFQIPYGEQHCEDCWGLGQCVDFQEGQYVTNECATCHGQGSVPLYWVSFSHYPWKDAEEGGPQPSNHLRLHGHIHNNGYTRNGFVPFLRNHINLSVEQTKYRPVNLKLLLDAVLLGEYPETTPEQLEEVRRKRDENYQQKEAEDAQ